MRQFAAIMLLCSMGGVMAAARPASAEESDGEMGRRVQAMLRAHQDDVFGCVRASRTRASGEMLVRVFVGEGGRAERPEVLKDDSGGGAPLGKCLVEKLRRWDLQPLGAQAGDQVVFPLAFKPEPGTVAPLTGEWEGERVSIALERARKLDRPMVIAKAPHETAWVVLAPAERRGEILWVRNNLLRASFDGEAQLLRVSWREWQNTPSSGGRKPAEVKPLAILGGKGQVRLLLDGLGVETAIDWLEAEAGAAVPPHKHDDSDELIYVVAGRATTTVEGARLAAKPGDLLYIPKGAEHAMTVDERLTAVQIYSPAGPEQRFKTLNSGSKN
ncbi:MAG TPA: cupin domain-containing protein [Polyangia bacterium]|nr:cupin domain-containing protein [Polyangia bacterium]